MYNKAGSRFYICVRMAQGTIENKEQFTGMSYETINSFKNFQDQIKKIVGGADLPTVYKEIGEALETSNSSVLSIKVDESTGDWVLKYKGTELGAVNSKDKLKDIFYDMYFKAGVPSKTKNDVDAIVTRVIEMKTIQSQVTNNALNKLDNKIENTDIFDGISFNGKPIASQLNEAEKYQLYDLLVAKKNGEEGPFVLVYSGGKKGLWLKEENGLQILKNIDGLPLDKLDDRQEEIEEINEEMNKYNSLKRDYEWSVPFAVVLDNLRASIPRCAFQKFLYDPNKYTTDQLEGLEDSLKELLELHNDAADVFADIMENHSVVPDITRIGVLRIIQQQESDISGVGLYDRLTEENLDFDKRHYAKAIAPKAKIQEGGLDMKDASGGIDQYMTVRDDLKLEEYKFEDATPEALVAGYKKAEDIPGQERITEMFKIALAKRMLAHPEQIDAIRTEGNFTSEELHTLVFAAYVNTDLIKTTKAAQKNKQTKAFFEKYDVLWKGKTSDPATGIKVNAFINSFAEVHTIPFANVHATFSAIYPQSFDKLSKTLDEAMELDSTLDSFGMGDIGEKGLSGAARGWMEENTNMTPNQAAGRKKWGNIAVIGFVAYQFLWKGLYKGEFAGGRMGAVMAMLGLQLGAQAMTGEGILAFGSKVLNGGLDQMEILGYTKKDKDNIANVSKEAKKNMQLSPEVVGGMSLPFMFGSLKKSEIAEFVGGNKKDGYFIQNKKGLIAKHGEDSLFAIFLKEDDKLINKQIHAGLSLIDYDTLGGDVVIGDVVSEKIKEKAAEAVRIEGLKKDMLVLENQFAPFTMEEKTKDIYFTLDTNLDTKARLEYLIAIKPKLDEELLLMLPGLTTQEQNKITLNFSHGDISGVANKYICGDIDDVVLFEELSSSIAGSDGVLAAKLATVFDPAFDIATMQEMVWNKLATQLDAEMTGMGLVTNIKDEDARNMKVNTDGASRWLRSYNEEVTKFDPITREIAYGGMKPIDFGLSSDEEVIKTANFINAVVHKFRGTIKPSLLKYLQKNNEPFTYTDNPVHYWKETAGIEVNVFDKANWNPGLYDITVVSQEGLSYISPVFATPAGKDKLLGYLNYLYLQGAFNTPPKNVSA